MLLQTGNGSVNASSSGNATSSSENASSFPTATNPYNGTIPENHTNISSGVANKDVNTGVNTSLVQQCSHTSDGKPGATSKVRQKQSKLTIAAVKRKMQVLKDEYLVKQEKEAAVLRDILKEMKDQSRDMHDITTPAQLSSNMVGKAAKDPLTEFTDSMMAGIEKHPDLLAASRLSGDPASQILDLERPVAAQPEGSDLDAPSWMFAAPGGDSSGAGAGVPPPFADSSSKDDVAEPPLRYVNGPTDDEADEEREGHKVQLLRQKAVARQAAEKQKENGRAQSLMQHHGQHLGASKKDMEEEDDALLGPNGEWSKKKTP